MMGHPPLPIDLSRLPSGAIVVDLVYDPLETELLRDARDRGLKTVDGLAVLIWQASMAFTYFFGEAPGELCYDELRAKLTS
jgi:shikimate dehydrogenase